MPKQNVLSLAFSPDGRMLGVGGRDQVAVWNLETGRAVFKSEEVLGKFRIAFSPVGSLLVIGKHGNDLGIDDDGNAELWDYVSGEKQRVFPKSGGFVALSRRGDRLATGNFEQTVLIWDVANGTVVSRLKPAGVIAMAFSPDGQTLATSDWGSEVKMWDVSSGQMIGSLTKSRYRVWSLAFSPEGRFLAMGGVDQMVSLWDLATRQPIERLRGHGGEIKSVAFSADGQKLASGSRDRTAMIWSTHPHRAETTVSSIISRPIFSADSQLFAAGIGQNKVAVWDVATLQPVAEFADAYDAVAFSADGRSVITRGTNCFLRTFDVEARAVLKNIPGRPAETNDSYAALSPNGQMLLVGLNEGPLTFSDAKTGVVLARTIHAQGNRIFQISFSPDGKLVATAGREAEATRVPAVEIWDLATQKKVATLLGHTWVVISAAFSPDGKTLASCSADTSIRFWDTTTWKETLPSLTLKEFGHSLAFSPNGRTLASDCTDGTVKLWNVATRHELASIKVDDPKYIFFAPDGQTLAVWCFDNSLRLLRAPVPEAKLKW